MKHLGDITKIRGYDVPRTEVVIGGSPCQDLSVAGLKAGLSGERSGLFMEQIRIIKEMRARDEADGRTDTDVYPRFMVWENVPGAFSSNKGEDFRTVLEEVARIADETVSVPRYEGGRWTNAGAIIGDGWSIAWRLHDAQFWGVPQRRKRIALVADFGGLTAPEILFERKSLSGDTEPGGKAGQETAGDSGSRTETASGCLNGWDVQSKHIQSEQGIAEALYSGECRYGGGESYVMQEVGSKQNKYYQNTGHGWWNESDIGATIRTPAGGDAVKANLVCIPINTMCATHTGTENSTAPFGIGKDGDPQFTLQNKHHHAVFAIEGNGSRDSHFGNGYKESETMYSLNTVEVHGVCAEPLAIEMTSTKNTVVDDGISPTLTARMGTGGNQVNAVCIGTESPEICGTLDAIYYKGTGSRNGTERTVVAVDCRNGNESDINGTLQAKPNGGTSLNTNNVVRQNYIVRRLTPRECERLQGYPDGWCDIGEWTDSKGKKHKDADSPKYKALGNSIALPYWQWMLGKMIRYCKDKTMASLFDGIGGFPMCWLRVGGVTLWASEIEEYPIAVTKYHFGEN